MPYNMALKVAILHSRMTQIALAKRTRINEARLSRIIHGHDTPTAREMSAIARALRRPKAALFPETDDAAPQEKTA
jgi:transcriptional regulator with XRE-family HTH domain